MDGMRRMLGASILVSVAAACTGIGPGPSGTPDAVETAAPVESASPSSEVTIEPVASPIVVEPSPVATAIEATAGTASIEPRATVKPARTAKPASSPVPPPKATPVPSGAPLDHPALRYLLVDQLGRPLFCDPDFYPIARDDEAVLAQENLAAIRSDTLTWAAIVAHLGIDPGATPDASQTLEVYREWKMLRAVRLTEANGHFAFDYIAAAADSGETGWHVLGTIDPGGTIAVDRREPSGPPPCPICLARGTRIATPDGERTVETLRPGMAVWTTDAAGQRVAGLVLEVGSTPVRATHEVVHLVLSDGRFVDVSPGHRLPDGRRLGDLREGDVADGATVVSARLEAYDGGATFDLLPSGPTGNYWANGILLASTLTAPR